MAETTVPSGPSRQGDPPSAVKKSINAQEGLGILVRVVLVFVVVPLLLMYALSQIVP